MKHIRYLLFLIFIGINSSFLFSQGINIDNYKSFLETNKGMTSDGLRSKYPIGLYRSSAGYSNTGICYMDSADLKLQFTEYEKELLAKHNFMVTERLSYTNFWSAYKDVFEKDLPVYISTDALLHAVHMSYDAILKDLEQGIIIPKLDIILKNLHEYTTTLNEKYSAYPEIIQAVRDYDVYLSIAAKLLCKSPANPVFVENEKVISELMGLINKKNYATYPLFADTPRSIDFSQFTVRGHYTENFLLEHYFMSMIWLGRTELYLIPPQPAESNPVSMEDIRRQVILSYLILEAVENTGMSKEIDKIDNLIRLLVGESDNVKLNHLKELKQELTYSITDFTDTNNVKKFQVLLAGKSYADQKILSQVLWKCPMNPEKIQPASAFLLFGQRFIIDSYITGSVVWDKTTEMRMLPSTLDILFALGNNAASEFLKKELDEYKYSLNLSALRYLVDSYDDDFWSQSYYNSWLNTIRTLNPPDDASRAKLPKFMQTAAWWQEKMNTQLASWAQLRHDNLLYAKQSYTGGIECSNPDAYLEPIPEFYAAIVKMADFAAEKLPLLIEDTDSDSKYFRDKVRGYFLKLSEHCGKLNNIAIKELSGEGINDGELAFLRSVYSYQYIGCGEYDHEGWYSELFYHEDNDAGKKDYLVADIHTAPTDAAGNLVGWVVHVGTGEINLGVFVTENSLGEMTAYAGPVMSYHENISTNFKRYTDEEWSDGILTAENTTRPEFVNLYLANKTGSGKISGSLPVTLPVGVSEPDFNPVAGIDINSWPNPFTEYTVLSFPVSSENSLSAVEVSIFGNNMQLLKTIYTGKPQQGNYSARWDGTDNTGKRMPSGSYYARITINGKSYGHKLLLVR